MNAPAHKRVSEKRKLRDITLWAERWHSMVFLCSRLKSRRYRPSCGFSVRVERWPTNIADQLDYVQDAVGVTAKIYSGDRDAAHLMVLASHWTDLARQVIPEITTTRDARGFDDAGEQARILGSIFKGLSKRPEGFRAYKHDSGETAA